MIMDSLYKKCDNYSNVSKSRDEHSVLVFDFFVNIAWYYLIKRQPYFVYNFFICFWVVPHFRT